MNDNQHFTPGPWVAVSAITRWHGTAPLFADGLWHILPESNLERLPICEVDHADDYDEPTRQHAEVDARLIAAAPELFDALNKAIAYLANPQAFDAEELGRDWWALKSRIEGSATLAASK